MPGERPEELVARAAPALRRPPVEEWATFPFSGALDVRPLLPSASEPPRHGVGGVGCGACAARDEDFLWTDANWRLRAIGPTGLPAVVILDPREHLDFADLRPKLAAELGPLLLRVHRAVMAIPHVGNVHCCRWGDGSEHLHWWFLARPANIPQLIGSFAAIWDDVLPPLPDDLWKENMALIAAGLR